MCAYWCSYILCTFYAILGIVYLVKYYTFVHECQDSHLWEYVLLSLVVGCAIVINHFLRINDAEKMAMLACNAIPVGGLFIWGFIENVCIPCNFLINTPIFVYSQITFVIQLLFVFMMGGYSCGWFFVSEYDEI